MNKLGLVEMFVISRYGMNTVGNRGKAKQLFEG
jgi:hypothetical protein